jgi:hypothetical protein
MRVFDETRSIDKNNVKSQPTPRPPTKHQKTILNLPKSKRVSTPAVTIKANLDPVEFAKLPNPAANPFTLLLTADKVALTTLLNTKSVRKAIDMITEHGPGAVTMILTGRLATNNTITAAGLAVQIKGKRAE